jgi:putative transposase
VVRQMENGRYLRATQRLKLRERLRTRLGRNPLPSAGIADSQSAKSTGVGGEQRGYDGHKKVRGILSVTCSWTPRVCSSKRRFTARRYPTPGRTLRLLLEPAQSGISRLKHLWLDAGYEGRGKRWAEEALGMSVEVVRKPQRSRFPRR